MARGQNGSVRAPCPLEHVRQQQHRHVAANAVALLGDLVQLADHRLLRSRIAVVELQRIRPAGEVRIAAVCQNQVAARGGVTRM